MLRPRAIPLLTVRGTALVKTLAFGDSTYLGDPRNAVRIFNEKEVDELILADIGASRERRAPDLKFLSQIVDEAFMPVAYAGGVSTLEDIRSLMRIGVEKIVFNSAAGESPEVVSRASSEFGVSTIAVSIDYRTLANGRREVFIRGGTVSIGRELLDYASEMAQRGAGEILLTSIERDGTRQGYDWEGVRSVTSRVSVPVVASGGARNLADLGRVVRECGASGAAAGAMFVFRESRRAILISYPSRVELDAEFGRA